MGRRSVHTADELRELILGASTELIETNGLAGLDSAFMNDTNCPTSSLLSVNSFKFLKLARCTSPASVADQHSRRLRLRNEAKGLRCDSPASKIRQHDETSRC